MSVSCAVIFDVTIEVPASTWSETEAFTTLKETLIKEATQKLRSDLAKINYVIRGTPKTKYVMAVEKD